MAAYMFDGRLVDAKQWTGELVPGVEAAEARWGVAGSVQTLNGPVMVSPGDWIVYDGDNLAVVSPAIFSRAAPAND